MASRNPERDAAIVDRRREGLTYQAIADEFDLHPTRIKQIVNHARFEVWRRRATRLEYLAGRRLDWSEVRALRKIVDSIDW